MKHFKLKKIKFWELQINKKKKIVYWKDQKKKIRQKIKTHQEIEIPILFKSKNIIVNKKSLLVKAQKPKRTIT